VEITLPSGKKQTDYYAVESGLKIRSVSTVDGPQGPMTTATDMGDYKAFDGVMFPTSIKAPLNPQMTMEVSVEEIIINEEVDKSIFD
jgi:hypothetical protein